MKVLELFSGTGSVGKVCKELGWEVVSVDIDPNTDATYVCDINDFDYREKFRPGDFDIVWASPPCQYFSICRKSWIGREIKKHPHVPFSAELYEQDLISEGLPPLNRTLDILEYLKPKLYYIENPQTSDMKKYMTLPFIDVDYCRFGFPYRKRTRIWTNDTRLSNQLCEGIGKCPAITRGNHHAITIGKVDNTSLQERYRIPPQLLTYLFNN